MTKRHLGTSKGYQSYVKMYEKNMEKYGFMDQPMICEEDYTYIYESYYNDRVAEKKDTKNINRLIVYDSTFELSNAQAKAEQRILKERFGRKVKRIDLRLGTEKIEEEEWQELKKLYHDEKKKWIEEHGIEKKKNKEEYKESMKEFYKFYNSTYWGSL